MACDAALASGQLLKACFGELSQSYYKGDRGPVTQADIDAEKIILEILRQQFPSHGFLSEEAGLQKSQIPFLWVIDPLDGTTNFVHGLPHFGVSIALQKDGVTIVGVVYQPITGELFTSVSGYGAYMNGVQLKVSRVATISGSILGTGFATSLELRGQQQLLLSRFLPQCEAIREPVSAAIGLCNVARGNYDCYWELGLSLWDVAAGTLLVTEAGGTVTIVRRGSFGHQVDIFASNGRLHQVLLQTV